LLIGAPHPAHQKGESRPPGLQVPPPPITVLACPFNCFVLLFPIVSYFSPHLLRYLESAPKTSLCPVPPYPSLSGPTECTSRCADPPRYVPIPIGISSRLFFPGKEGPQSCSSPRVFVDLFFFSDYSEPPAVSKLLISTFPLLPLFAC